MICISNYLDKKELGEFKMKVTNIDWDTDGDKELKSVLPQEMDVPDNMSLDEISDYISDKVGFCHNGFILQTRQDSNKKLTD